MKRKYYYITTTLPYVNASPHIGFALEVVQADVLARYQRKIGNKVFFNCGTDEHGQKIFLKSKQENLEPQEYVDIYANKFLILKDKLNLTFDAFIRTTDPKHIKATQEIWTKCLNNGFIEKGVYKAKYCVGCELEKQDSELVEGKCPLHPNQEIQSLEEENYFFKFSKFQKKLLDFYQQNPDFVIPQGKLKEIKSFVKQGLKDFSVSRLKEKMPWGIDVPNDPKHVMYVWFDALTNYISTLGWPDNMADFEKFWGTNKKPNAVQIAGKDNLRQQSAMWQAMLLASNLPPTKQILIHGFITSNGQKMSKSLGNVIDPIEYVNKYSTDALRYYLLAKISPTEDSDFTKEKFELAYNSDLANSLGNLVSRIGKLASVSKFKNKNKINLNHKDQEHQMLFNYLDQYKFDEALKYVWQIITKIDVDINQNEPWKLEGKKLYQYLDKTIQKIILLSSLLDPFMPETAQKIQNIFSQEKITIDSPLFPRI